ncbi:TPA: hypothetical protein U1C31_000305 [Streptococcus suis]|nr:hypothetical protein [Streptococcus suis]
MEQLKLSIKPKFEPSEGQSLRSSGYRVQVGDWELGKGVKKMTLEMDAGKKPKLVIEAEIDYMDIDTIHGLGLELVDTSEQEIKFLSTSQVAEIAEYRTIKREKRSYDELRKENEKHKKQLMISQVTLISIFFLIDN